MAAGEKKTFADKKTLARIVDKAVAAQQVRCKPSSLALFGANPGTPDPSLGPHLG